MNTWNFFQWFGGRGRRDEVAPGPGIARRHWPRAVIGIAGALLLAWGSWQAFSAWRFGRGLEWARAEASAGQYAGPKRWLADLSPPWSDDPEAAYWLGVCEQAEGRYEEAVKAWAKVVPPSTRFTSAALLRSRTLIENLGRFAEAEALLALALAQPGAGRPEIRRALTQLEFWEGRHDAMRRSIREGWERADDRPSELRILAMMDLAPARVEMVRDFVERASSLAPDDDRVWLAKAYLSLREGRFADASRLLDSCTKRRPDDAAVWRARLELDRASGDLEGVERALTHLPTSELTDAEVLDLRAWSAGSRGDRDAERRALEALVELSPGDTKTLDRLAALAWDDGRRELATELRKRKADADHAKDRYRELLKDLAPSGSYVELAGLAESLGRRFEAQGWWTLAALQAPDDPVIAAARARLQASPESPRPPDTSTTLAERVGIPRGEGGPHAGPRDDRAPQHLPAFVDDAEAAGLRFTFDNGLTPLRQLPETMSGGVGLLDADGDGRLDVFVVQGGAFPPDPGRPDVGARGGDRLFRNHGDGTFEDVTQRSGLAAMPQGYGHGVAVGDVDNDGDPDLFVTRWRSYALYRNRGDGTFENATGPAGLGGDRDWPTSAAFADLDGDGDLDLYVCHYLQWDADNPTLCGRSARPEGPAEAGRPHGYCMPHPFPARPDHLFRNDGGRFVDVTEEAGIVDRDGRGLGVVAADLDDDGKIDLFVANDTTANYFFRNLGGMRFEEQGFASGVACNADGAFQAGMGVASGDLDRDGRIDLFVTNFYGESTTYFRNLGRGMFADQTAAAGLSAPSRFLLGFGIAALDVNNDARLDLAVANGHVNDERPDFPYAMPSLLLLGLDGGRLKDVGTSSKPPWSLPRVGRGLASGDLDNDGRIDLVQLSQNGPLAYFHNRSTDGHSITFRLEGTASNRDAVGARVILSGGGRRQMAQRVGGGSYQSAADPRLHFGLDTLDRVETVEVRWPSGHVDIYHDLPADTGYTLREGDPGPKPLEEFSGRGR